MDLWSQIMEPIRHGDKDLLLVFCPGAFQASEDYFSLMQEIQAQLSLRLWVVILYTASDQPLSTERINCSLTGVIARVQQRGFRPGSMELENLFIAGHRWGSYGFPHLTSLQR